MPINNVKVEKICDEKILFKAKAKYHDLNFYLRPRFLSSN